MKNCHDIKKQIENASLRELEADSDVTTHCESCIDCNELLQSRLESEFSSKLRYAQRLHIKNDRALKKVEQTTTVYKKQLKIAITGCLVSLFSLFWFSSVATVGIAGGAILLTWSFASGGYAYYISQKKNVVEAALFNLDQSLFEHCRREVVFKISVIKFLGAILLLESLFLLTAVMVNGMTVASGLPVFIGISMIFALFVLYQFIAVLPQLKNELHMLGEGS